MIYLFFTNSWKMKKKTYRYFSFGLIKGINLIKGGLKTCFALHTNDAVIGYRLIS